MEVKDVKKGANSFEFDGFASTFGNKDLQGDIIKQGAFGKSLSVLEQRRSRRRSNEKLFPMLFNHDMDRQIGSFIEARETQKGLEVKGRLNTKLNFVREYVMPLVEEGDLDEMSIGFVIEERSFEGDTRVISQATLLETSMVTIAANPESLMKGFEGSEFDKMRLTFDDISDEQMNAKEIEAICRTCMSGSVAKKVANFLVSEREAQAPANPREVDSKDASDLLDGLKSLNANLRGD